MQRLSPALLLAVGLSWCSAAPLRAEAVPAPFELRCAKAEADAARALDALSAQAQPPFELPVEERDGRRLVRATQVDRMLRELASTRQRFPGLARRVDGVLLSFSYCDVFFEGRGWNLALVGGELVRSLAEPPADGWLGFAAWGFVDPDKRIVPGLLEDNPLGRGQREWFVSEVVHDRCFPHPVTGFTPFNDPTGMSELHGAVAVEGSTGPLPVPAKLEACPAPPVAAVTDVARAVEPKAALTPVTSPTEPAPSGPQIAAVQGAPGAAATTTPANAGSRGFSGAFYHSLALAGRASMGARVAWSFYPSAYVRAGLVQPLAGPLQRPTYSWGIGYNDWRPDTISVEINNWGPIPIDRFDLKGATLDVGYKVQLPSLIAPYAGLSLGFSYPFAAYPGAGFGVSVKPWRDWFVSGGMRWYPFNESPVTWTYGFGNWSWRPYTFSLAYSNWGPNAVFTPNFERNGQLTLAWSWAL